MVAAMRTIIDDILLYMSTDTDNDTDSDADKGQDRGNHSDKDSTSDTHTATHSGIGKNTDSDVHSNTNTDTHSNSVINTDANTHNAHKTRHFSDRDRTNTSHNTGNNSSPLFEFYPHISPKLADNWDFKSTLEAATFPFNDSVNIANWLKKRRKHDILQNRVDSKSVSEVGDVKSTNEAESEGSKEDCEIEGDRSDRSATLSKGHSPVLIPVPVPTHSPTPTPNPVSAPTPETASPYPQGSLSIQMGEFTKVYGHIDQENQFDCVVTCFFIDTATDILEYLAVIAHVLREGTNNFLIYFLIVCNM